MKARLVLLVAGTLAALACSGELAARAEADLTADVSATEIGIDDSLRLTVRISGDSLARGVQAPALPPLVNLKVAGGPSTSTSFQWINGEASSEKSFTWLLVPLREGEAAIPPIEVRIGDAVRKTGQITLKVLPQSPAVPRGERASPAREASPGGQIVVKGEAEPRRAYVGQPISLSYRLLTRVPVAQVSPEQLPSFDGFLVDDVPVDSTKTRRRVVEGGVAYDEYVLARKLLTPTEPGRRRIEPTLFRVTAEVESDDLFDRFFRGSLRELRRSTEGIDLEVLSLPEAGRPADFSGAVGRFEMKAALDRSEAATGDAVGFNVTLEGTGDLRGAAAPGMAALSDFRVYDPKVDEKSDLREARRHTIRTWSYVLVPLAPGRQEIPALRFSYFDPEEGAYKLAVTHPEVLMVRRGVEPSPSGPAVGRQEITQLRRDLHYLKALDGPLRRSPRPLYRRPAYYLWLLLPPLVVPAAMAARTIRTAGGRERTRRRQAWRHARKALTLAARGGVGGGGGSLHDALSAALLGYLSQLWRVSAAGLTHERIEEGLAADGVPDGTRLRVKRFLEACDSLRFAPASGGAPGQAATVKEARAVLDELERGYRLAMSRRRSDGDSRAGQGGAGLGNGSAGGSR